MSKTEARRKAVADCLAKGIETHVEISKITGIPHSSVNRAVAYLKKHKAINDNLNDESGWVEDDQPAKWEEKGNEATGSYVATVSSLEGLLEALKVDSDVWTVDHWVGNQWQQGSKIEGKVVVTPLWQVKAWFVRKVATTTVFPTIHPVVYNLPRPKVQKITAGKIKKAIIIPDIQVGFLRTREGMDPFHDRKAMDAVLQLVRLTNPDLVVFLGDLLDLPEWTDKFLRSPDMTFTTQPSLDELGWYLAQIRHAAPQATIKYFEGNHEARLRNHLITHLSAAYDLKPANTPDDVDPALSIPNLLNLKSLDIEYLGPYPNGEFWFNSNLSAGHGETVRAGSGDTVKAILKELRHSHICGHIHRCEQASETRYMRDGAEVYTCISPGTLARLDGPIPKAKKRMNWSHGCAELHYEEAGLEQFQANLLPIFDGRILYGNQVIQGENYYERMPR